MYLFSSDARQLFEVKSFHEEYRSWFIGQAVQQGEWNGKACHPFPPVNDVQALLLYSFSGNRFLSQSAPVWNRDVTDAFCLSASEKGRGGPPQKRLGNIERTCMKAMWDRSKRKERNWVRLSGKVGWSWIPQFFVFSETQVCVFGAE